MNEFAERVCDIRKKNGVSQYKLAKDLGLCRSTVSKWESGDRMPSFEVMVKIAEYFGVSTDYFYGITDEPAIQAFADPADAELLAATQGKLKNFDTLPDHVQALNTLLGEYGYYIRRVEGEADYNVFTRDSMFPVPEDVLDGIAATSAKAIKEKIDYLDMENKVRLLEELKKKHTL